MLRTIFVPCTFYMHLVPRPLHNRDETMRDVFLLSTILVGCVPVIDDGEMDNKASADGEAAPSDFEMAGEAPEQDLGNSNGESSDAADGPEDSPEAGGEEDGVGSDGDSETGQVASGTWVLADAVTIDDPCRWLDVIEGMNLSALSFLPSSFAVNAYEDGFELKALNFGARDNIDCTVSGDDFACSLQTVDALEVTDGWPRSWVYEIDFRGTILNEARLVGIASVEFPQVNPGDAFYLGAYGMDNDECGQAFELTLELP